MSDRPRFQELPDGSAAGVFGANDQLGCLNLLTAERVRAAAGLIQTGEAFGLNAPLDWPDPNFFGSNHARRTAPLHTIMRWPAAREDKFDGFFPQLGTQWDGFLHIMDPTTRTFYNNSTDEAVGLSAWAARGIVGRGVLLDVAAWAQRRGAPIDWRSATAVGVDMLEACATEQGVAVDEGTILLVRTGWQTGWNGTSYAGRVTISQSAQQIFPGLEPSPAMAEWLWDSGVAAVAADNPGLEVFPIGSYFLHIDLLAKFGMPIGEYWQLDELARVCHQSGRFEFFLTSAPLNVRGGVGSTANALAIL
jgi:kynurenine formamidase